jgi:hypothetical protein
MLPMGAYVRYEEILFRPDWAAICLGALNPDRDGLAHRPPRCAEARQAERRPVKRRDIARSRSVPGGDRDLGKRRRDYLRSYERLHVTGPSSDIREHSVNRVFGTSPVYGWGPFSADPDGACSDLGRYSA